MEPIYRLTIKILGFCDLQKPHEDKKWSVVIEKYISHSNNVLIWFTKQILVTVFFNSIFRVSQMTITHIF